MMSDEVLVEWLLEELEKLISKGIRSEEDLRYAEILESSLKEFGINASYPLSLLIHLWREDVSSRAKSNLVKGKYIG